VDLKLLKFLWKRSRQTSFKNSTDFVLAVQLRHIKLDEKAQPEHEVSETHATMVDGTQAPAELALSLRFKGTASDLSAAKETFIREIYRKDSDSGDQAILPDIELDDDEEDE
jgi:hypothetical protein